MNIDEIKKELTENVKEAEADYANYPENGEYPEGYASGCEYAIELLENLQEKKVIIPEFIANDIKYHKNHGSTLRGTLGSTFAQDVESDVYCWFFDNDGYENIRKYISAWDNGYEVEKEPKYYVKIKHFNSSDNILYVNHDNARGDFFIDNKKQSTSFNTIFTKSYLKHHWTGYEAYNNAGLLEFEEVEDE